MAHIFQDIQDKTNDIVGISKKIGLTINVGKTKVMIINTRSEEQLGINNTAVEEVKDFRYLGSKIKVHGDSGKDVQNRIVKARGAFDALKRIWKPKNQKATS